MVSTPTTPLERLLQGTLTPSSVSGLPQQDQTCQATTESSVSRRATQRLHGYGHQTSCHGCGVTNETIGGFMLQCGKCRKAYYCGRDCFNAHLATHQQFCRTHTLDCCEPNKRPLVDVWYVANQVPSSSSNSSNIVNVADAHGETKTNLPLITNNAANNSTTTPRRFVKKTYIDASCSESETETESVAPNRRAPRRKSGPPQEGRRAVVAAVAPTTTTTTTTTTNQTAPTTRNVNETDDEEDDDDDDTPPSHRLLLLPASLHHATATDRNAVPDNEEEADSMYDEETIDETVEEYTIPDEQDDQEDDLDDSTIEEWDEEEEENDDQEDDYDEETVESSERYADIYCIINGQRVRRRPRRPCSRRAQDKNDPDEADNGDWHDWRRNRHQAAATPPVKKSFCDSSCSESETETESLAEERQRCLRRSSRRGKRPTVAATPVAASATPETPPSDTEMEESMRRHGGGPLDYHCSWSPLLATSDMVSKEAGSKQDVQVCHNVDTSRAVPPHAVPPHAVVGDLSMVRPDDGSRRLAHPDDSRPTTIGTSSDHGDCDIEESRTMCGGGNLHGGATAVLPPLSHDGQWPPVALKWTIPTKSNVDWEKPLWTHWRYVETVQ
jgi:MYND finger